MNRAITLCVLILVAMLALPVVAQRKPIDTSHKNEIIRRYEMLLEGSPDGGFALRKLLDLLGTGPALVSAIGRYRKKISKRPKKYAYHVILGHLLLAKKEYSTAIDSYRQAIKLKPRSSSAYLGIARIYIKQKKMTEALNELELAAKMTRDRSARERIIRRAVKLAIKMKDLKRAKGMFQRIIKLDPGNVQIRVEYAEMLEREKRYSAALAEWKSIQSRFRGDPKTRVKAAVAIAGLLGKLGRTDEAVKLYRTSMKKLPGSHWLRRHIREKIVELYRQMNKLQELIKMTLKERKTFAVLLQLAKLYEEVGDDTNSEKYLKAALKKNPRHLESHQALIKLYVRTNDKDKLFKAYETMTRLNPGNPKYELKLAELYFQYNEEKKAIKLLSKISRRYPKNATVHVRLIDIYFQSGGTDPEVKKRIEAEYRLLIRIEPKKVSHVVGLGEFYWSERNRPKAEKQWLKVLQMIPKKGEAHFQLAKIYADHKYRQQAVEHYRKAVNFSPDQLKYRKAFARILERYRRYPEAVTEWEQVLRLSEKMKGPRLRIKTASEARRRIVHLYYVRQMLPGQIGIYRRKFDRTPPERKAGYLLGQAYAKMKSYDQAEKVYKKLLTLNNKDLIALLALQEIYILRNKLSLAVAILERIAEIDKLRAREIWQKIAVFLLNLNKKSDAEKYARMAVDFDPTNPTANARLGRIYWQLGKTDKAIESYKKAIRHNRRNFKFYFELARIYQSEQKLEPELELMKKVVKESSDSAQILIAGRRALVLHYRLKRIGDQEPLVSERVQTRPNVKVYKKLRIELYHFQVNDIISRHPNLKTGQRELRRVADQGIAVLKEALSHQDVRIRSMAIDVLRHIKNPGAVMPLVRALEQNDVLTRFQAAIALGQIGNPAAIPALVRRFKDKKYQIKKAAIWAVGAIKHAKAVEALVTFINSGVGFRGDRALALLGLGNQGGDLAIKTLLKALSDSNSQIKQAAALALGYLRPKQGASQLIERLKLESYWPVKKNLIWALGRIRAPRAVEPLLNELWSRNTRLREITGWALLQFGRPVPSVDKYSFAMMYLSFVSFGAGRIHQRLNHLNLSEELVEADSATIRKLVATHRRAIVKILRKKLATGTSSERYAVLSELSHHPKHFTLGLLTGVIPRQNIGQPLWKLLDDLGADLKGSLLKLFSDKDPFVREKAVELVGKIGERSAMGTLVRLLREDKSVVVRKAAVRALVRFNTPSVLPHLKGLAELKDERYWDLRATVAAVIADVRWPGVIPVLGLLLRDPVHLVRIKALEGLMKIGGTESRSMISSALKSSNVELVVDIIETIADRRLNAWIGELRRLKSSARIARVQEAASMALKLLSTR